MPVCSQGLRSCGSESHRLRQAARIAIRLAILLVVAAASVMAGASAARANHIPGAVYTGTNSGGGTVEFHVSAEGSSVTYLKITNLPGDTCTFTSIEFPSPSFPIVNHAFAYEGTNRFFRGTFDSPPARDRDGAVVSAADPSAAGLPDPDLHVERDHLVGPSASAAAASTTAAAASSATATARLRLWCRRSASSQRSCGSRSRRPSSRSCAPTAALGWITRAYSTVVPRGRVISQKPRPGTRLANGARVHLRVSRGRR